MKNLKRIVDRQNGNLRSLKQEIRNLRLLGSEKNKIEVEKKIEKLEKLLEKKEMNNQMQNLQKQIQKNIHNQLNEFFNPYNHCNFFNLNNLQRRPVFGKSGPFG